MTGIFLASGLSRRVRTIETNIQLLGYLYDRLRYLQPSVLSLMEDAAGLRQFQRLGYLEGCLRRMRAGSPFPTGWREAVEEAYPPGDDVGRLLASLDQVLGAADLDSQLASLDYTRDLLRVRLKEAREYLEKHGKLYRTLGVLCGLAAAILLI